jgi:hypothetical protein
MRLRNWREDRGSIIVLAAIVVPILLGFAALALDAGYYFDYKQRMGAAADAAALSGAFELKRDAAITQSSLETYIRDDAARNGFTHGTNGVTVTVSHPPVTGLHINDTKYVEVVISKPSPRFFSRLWGSSDVTVNARAVAGPDEGTGCVYALTQSDKNNNPEFSVPNGTVISVPNCDVVVNGDFTTVTGSKMTANAVYVGGTSTVAAGTLNVTPTASSQAADPFADLDEATLFGTSWTCGWNGQSKATKGGAVSNISGTGVFTAASGNSYTMNPGVYCGAKGAVSIKIGLNGPSTPDPPGTCNAGVDEMVTFLPGIYILVGGGLDWKHSCVVGTGVVFYFTGTAANPYVSCGNTMMSTDPPDRFFLSAPLSTTSNFKKWDGTSTSPLNYEGLLFIQDRRQGTGAAGAFPAVNCATGPNYVEGNILPENMIMDGSLYFPNQHLLYGATSLSGGNYTVLITGTIQFSGAATFNSNFSGLAGGSPVKRPGLGE